MTEIPYDYGAKGAADYAAGEKDLRLYGDTESNHGRSYRTGWQNARRADPTSPDPGEAEAVSQPQEALNGPPAILTSSLRERARHSQIPALKQPKPDQLNLF